MHSEPRLSNTSTCRQLHTKCANEQYNADRNLYVDHYGNERDAHSQHYSHSGCDECATARFFDLGLSVESVDQARLQDYLHFDRDSFEWVLRNREPQRHWLSVVNDLHIQPNFRDFATISSELNADCLDSEKDHYGDVHVNH